MKDAAHHRKHVQKKVIQSVRKAEQEASQAPYSPSTNIKNFSDNKR